MVDSFTPKVHLTIQSLPVYDLAKYLPGSLVEKIQYMMFKDKLILTDTICNTV